MKHKNILLIIFFLTLFVFQQVQAGATIPSAENLSQINAAPENANILFDTVQVYVYQLVPNSGALLPSHERCAWPDDFGVYGCGDNYPRGSLEPDGSLIVNVEQDYLRDVIAIEMNLAQITLDPEGQALKAQAIASRSVASWKSNNGPWDNGFGEPFGVWPRINNSNTYQVFIPGAHNTSNYKSAIDTAVNGTTGQFLQYIIGDNHVIDASFAADMLGAMTVDGDVSAPYLKGIQDPVSTGCVLDLGNAQYGMSQRGAIRWAKGQTCPEGTNTDWPVKWDYKQILVHYYTGIDIIDDLTGNKVVPDDRWNLLWHNNFGSPVGTPPTLTGGQFATLQIRLQNTSTTTWSANGIEIGYHWGDGNWQVASISEPFSDVSAGKEFPDITADLLTINVIPPSIGGAYTLHLDLRRSGGDWFSSAGWPDARIPVQVNGSSITPVPTTPAPITNYALRFQSPSYSQGILMPPATAIDFSGDMTIEFWIRTTSAYGGGVWHEAQWILDKDIPGGGQADWAVVAHNGRIVFNNGNLGGGDQPLYSVQTISDGVWHHVAITRNVSTGNGLTTIYIDGIQDTSSFLSTAGLGNPFALNVGVEGGVGGLTPRAFRGDLDELRLWSIARNQSDIQGNMHIRLQGNEPGLAGYWNFDEGTGQIANDGTQNQVDGQLGNSGSPDNYDPEWILAAEIFTSTPPTPVPTPTGPPLTPVPAPENCGCPSNELDNGCNPPPPLSSNFNTDFHTVSYTIQQALIDIQLLHRVEDEVLSQTPTGQHYIDLYYEHGFEIVDLLRSSSTLRDEAIATIQLWEPNLQALVDGNGSNVTITSGQVQAIQTFLDHLYALGSPELQQTIISERVQTPLEQTIGKTLDQAWMYLNGFPSTSVLDDFNRADGGIGSSWSGNTFGYNIFSNQLGVDYSGSNSDIYWSNEPFGADQEAYVTLTDVDAAAWEHDLLLKAQSNNTWGDGLLEVLYDPTGQRIQVWTYEWPAEWVQHGADIPVTFVDGDQFGARALADGTVEVYRNGELLATRDITSWSHYADGGYIGLWFIGAEDAVLDDFGGGTISSGMQSMSMGTSTFENQNIETSLTSEQLNVTLTNTNHFWQGVPIGSNQRAYVTFAQTNKSANVLSKPQSNGAWGEGVVEVLYDVPGGRIQVWMYDAQAGWVQYGRDTPVKFADGDQFSVRVLANGNLEIQQNGKSLAKLDVTP